MKPEDAQASLRSAALYSILDPLVEWIGPSCRPLFRKESARPPRQVGCGILVSIAGVRFLLTAAHVLDAFVDTPILVGGDDSLVEVPGHAERTEPPSGRQRKADRIDAGVLRVCEGYLDELERLVRERKETR